MALPERTFTAAEFDEFILLPEHGDTLFELINGRVYPVVSNNRSSRIGMRLGAIIVFYVNQHRLGRVTGADGGYIVAGERLMPDVAFISKKRQPRPSNETYNPLAPDLAVEVLSPSDNESNVRLKLSSYLSAETTVWIVNPETRTVEIHLPNKPPVKLTETDTIDGGDVLPGFSLPLSDIFADEE